MKQWQGATLGVCGAVAAGLMLGQGGVSVRAQNAPAPNAPTQNEGTKHVALVFAGGHETDPRDRGRPVVLVAGALGVPEQVFREAFTHVRPAPGGQEPDPQQVRRNKDALLQALAPYGVTNERLDEVSNYYRYRPQEGEMWPTQDAAGYATVKNGKITGFVITQGGAGYSSAPSVAVPGLKEGVAVAQLAFNKEFAKNGAVASVGAPTQDKR